MVSSTFTFKAIAAILSVISATNAHMIMKTPIPYGRGVINNSPLDNSGSDYPCKGIFDMTDPVNDVNHLVIGESNTLSFTGSAVHGGGSCQVSLTKDLRPTKQSVWMVIKSIEGGCPANVDGNLPADPNGSGAATFQYSVPDGIDPGEYTLGWTWFNRIGNREMYMNCGRASISASKKRYAPTPKKNVQQRAANLPDIFKANLAIFSQCMVAEGVNVGFPQPGEAVQIAGAAISTANCGGAAPAAPTGGAGSGASSAPAGTTALKTVTTSAAAAGPTGGFASGGAGGQATSAPAATGSGFGSQPTGGPGVFASGAASQSATSGAAPQPTAQASAAPVPSVSPIPAPGGNGGSSTPGTACSDEGAWLCASSGQSFQRCASGLWSAPMQVAAGTTCTPGQSMNLGMKVVTGGYHRRGSSHSHVKRAIRLSS